MICRLLMLMSGGSTEQTISCPLNARRTVRVVRLLNTLRPLRRRDFSMFANGVQRRNVLQSKLVVNETLLKLDSFT